MAESIAGRQLGLELEGHAHAAVLAGYKSQELPSSQTGGGGSNQLVFDDSPGTGRIELSSTQSQTRLQIGHLLQQTDNRRLQPRGHPKFNTSRSVFGLKAALAADESTTCSC